MQTAYVESRRDFARETIDRIDALEDIPDRTVFIYRWLASLSNRQDRDRVANYAIYRDLARSYRLEGASREAVYYDDLADALRDD